jgi:hypothetical protein
MSTYGMPDMHGLDHLSLNGSDHTADAIQMQHKLLITEMIGFVSKPFVEAIREKHDKKIILTSK